MRTMPEIHIYLKVRADLEEGEHAQRLAREICRSVERVYGVREAEVTSVISPLEE